MATKTDITNCKKFWTKERLGKLSFMSSHDITMLIGYVELLQAETERLKKLSEYARHKEGCNPEPWENECECGYLQLLEGSSP